MPHLHTKHTLISFRRRGSKELIMATHTSQRKGKASQMCGPPPEAEHLPCPRCDSINTKFCYYNNYNFSQPRHFCKSCRRYWTHGGTLRDIPMGGATRKHPKRSRTSITAAAASPVSSSSHRDFRHLPAAAASQLLVPHSADHGGLMPFGGDAKMGGSFTSLLMNNGQGNGLVALGGFGLGLDDVGFGLGRAAAVWPFQEVVEGRPAGASGGASTLGAHTWQLENGEALGFVGGPADYFAFPDLAISTPATVLK